MSVPTVNLDFAKYGCKSVKSSSFPGGVSCLLAVSPSRDRHSSHHSICLFSNLEQLFINNEFVAAKSGKTFEVVNPSDGTVIAQVAEADAADVDAAVEAAQKAYETSWGLALDTVRSILMPSLGGGGGKGSGCGESLTLWSHRQAVVNTSSPWQMPWMSTRKSSLPSKPWTMARPSALPAPSMSPVLPSASAISEFSFPFLFSLHSESYSSYSGGWADKIGGRTVEIDESRLIYTRHEPIGVVGQIIPWNFPILMLAWKVSLSNVQASSLPHSAFLRASGPLVSYPHLHELAELLRKLEANFLLLDDMHTQYLKLTLVVYSGVLLSLPVTPLS